MEGLTSCEQREAILEKLEHEGAINIVRSPPKHIGMYTFNNPTTTLRVEDIDLSYYLENANTIFLEILHPKFNEIYKKYEELNMKIKNKKSEKIGILNTGKNNTFIGNTFQGHDISIKDEGENTFAKGNKFFSTTLPGGKIDWTKWGTILTGLSIVVAILLGIMLN